MRLGFAGTPLFAVAALDALVQSRHTVATVFTKPDRPAGRGQAVQHSPVKQRAQALNIPVYQPASFRTPDAHNALRSLDLDALVVVAYGLILPADVLAAPRLGCFNIHASLLPRWRGAAPIHRALLAGDATTGITIMRMEAGLDTGPMLAARPVMIAAGDTAGTLHDRLAHVGGALIVETLDAIAAGEAREEPQPSVGVTYADKINKAEALIDWTHAAVQIVRRVRAFNPWPVAETGLDGAQLRVWEAEIAPAEGQANTRHASAPDLAQRGAGPPGAATAAGTAGTAGTAVDPSVADGSRAAVYPSVADAQSPAVADTPGVAAEPGTVLAATHAGIDVACGQGVVRILRLQLAGRKPLAAQEFIKAHPLVGARLSGP